MKLYQWIRRWSKIAGIWCGLGGLERLREIGQHPGFDSGLVCGREIDELYLYTPRRGYEGTGGARYQLNSSGIQDAPSDGQRAHHLREAKAQ